WALLDSSSPAVRILCPQAPPGSPTAGSLARATRRSSVRTQQLTVPSILPALLHLTAAQRCLARMQFQLALAPAIPPLCVTGFKTRSLPRQARTHGAQLMP